MNKTEYNLELQRLYEKWCDLEKQTVTEDKKEISLSDFICDTVAGLSLDTWDRCRLAGRLADFWRLMKSDEVCLGDYNDDDVAYDKLLIE